MILKQRKRLGNFERWRGLSADTSLIIIVHSWLRSSSRFTGVHFAFCCPQLRATLPASLCVPTPAWLHSEHTITITICCCGAFLAPSGSCRGVLFAPKACRPLILALQGRPWAVFVLPCVIMGVGAAKHYDYEIEWVCSASMNKTFIEAVVPTETVYTKSLEPFNQNLLACIYTGCAEWCFCSLFVS